MITVIDLKISNIASITRALKKLGIDSVTTDNPGEIEKAEKLILPGVGNFFEAMKRMRKNGLDKAIREFAVVKQRPLLGICLGMQLLASWGDEGGGCEGIGLVEGKVTLHRAAQSNMRLPHIGWNDVESEDFKLFDSLPKTKCFYFVHSYELIPTEKVVTATCKYGVDFVAAFRKNNIVGVQFHPEKSQGSGLKILENFYKGII